MKAIFDSKMPEMPQNSHNTEKKVLPAVNQIEYHVGMGNNFLGIRSYCAELGVLVQAYSLTLTLTPNPNPQPQP